MTTHDEKYADLSRSPLPSKKTVRQRQSLVRQFVLFAGFNLRLVRMVLKGHKG